MRKFKLIKQYPDSGRKIGDILEFEEGITEILCKCNSKDSYSNFYYTLEQSESYPEFWEEVHQDRRKVTIGLTEMQYRTQIKEIEVSDDVADDDVAEWLSNLESEIDDTVEWEGVDYIEEDTIPGVDSDRFDIYRNGEQVTGGHL